MKRKRKNRPAPAAEPRRTLPVWKKLLFAAVVCAGFFVLAELLLALIGVKPVLYARDPYVGFSSKIPLFERDSADDTLLVTAKNKQRFFNLQRFPRKKTAGTVRVFCLGGSTTYGHPYDDATSFCGWLREMLPRADASRRWELINCGGISYASYRVALLMEELIQYEPDLFIVYSGQNEFLEQRTYGDIVALPSVLRGAGALLSHTRIHAALKGVADKIQSRSATSTNSPNALSAEVETLLERVVGPQSYHRDDALQTNIITHFRFNLDRMVDIARTAGAKVMFVTPASNLRSCAPFKSEHRAGLGEADLNRWDALVARARQSAAAAQWSEALSGADQAAALDDRHAALHYLRGQALWQLQRFPEARAAFVRARDEDICPLRALSSMPGVVADVAAQRGVPVVDFVKLIDEKSLHQTPGEDWFLDHVHPTVEGNRLLALALIESMAGQGLVRTAANWNEAAQQEVKRAVESRVTPAQHSAALSTLAKVIAWAGKHDEAFRVSQRAVELAPNDAAAQFELGKNADHLGRHELALAHLRRALELKPGFAEARALLGLVLAKQGQGEDAIRQYREALKRKPDQAELHCDLASLLERAGRPVEAIAEFRESLRLSPNYAEAHNNFAWLLKDRGEFTQALGHFREAVRLKPGLPAPGIGLAWLLATHPDAAQRDPAQAIVLGERLVELSEYKNWMSLDALAAAYAASGRFDDATRTARKALELVRTASTNDAPGVIARLALYERREAFRESAAPQPR